VAHNVLNKTSALTAQRPATKAQSFEQSKQSNQANLLEEKAMPTLSLTHDQITLLFQEHRVALTQFLMYKIRCPETAQDLCQETYLRLLRDNALTHDENLSGFLFRVAERLAINYLKWQRLAKNSGIPLDEDLVCPKHGPDEMSSLRQQCEILLDAINSLPKNYAHVFLLRKIDELSYAEIAQRLGISEKTVQRHLVLAMLHCYQCMQHPEQP
jgi:RNA polymerase sigma-70 factor (ECF subfamily)